MSSDNNNYLRLDNNIQHIPEFICPDTLEQLGVCQLYAVALLIAGIAFAIWGILPLIAGAITMGAPLLAIGLICFYTSGNSLILCHHAGTILNNLRLFTTEEVALQDLHAPKGVPIQVTLKAKEDEIKKTLLKKTLLFSCFANSWINNWIESLKTELSAWKFAKLEPMGSEKSG